MIGFGGIAENRLAKEGFACDKARFPKGLKNAVLVGAFDVVPAREAAAKAGSRAAPAAFRTAVPDICRWKRPEPSAAGIAICLIPATASACIRAALFFISLNASRKA